MLIDRTPKIMQFSVNFEKDLIEMPFVAGLRPASAYLMCLLLTKLSAPLPNRFVRQHNTPRSQKIFSIPIPEGKSEIQPDSVAYKFDRKAMPCVGGRSWCIHAPILPYRGASVSASCLT